MKKILILLSLLLLLTIPVSANADTRNLESYLEKGEIIVDIRLDSNGQEEVFILRGKNYYKKIFEDKSLIKEEKLELRPTGLIIIENEERDKKLDQALEDRLGTMGITTLNLPYQVDHSASPYLPPVGLQEENSCVGWSAGYYLRTYQQGMDLGWQIKDGDIGREDRIFSPTFVYNQINVGKDEGKDGGATMEDAGNLLKEIGAATLFDFPYIPGDYLTQPDEEAIQSAYPHRIRDWKVLYTKEDPKNYIIQKTKEYLNTGDLPLAGVKAGFKFNYPYTDHNGIAIITTDNFANFNHAVVVVGYDDNLETPEGYGAFKIINSYGTDWGNDGFAYMSYDGFVEAALGGYVFTDLVNNDYLRPIENLKGEPISPTKYKISFDKVENATGYRLLNENKIVISNFYINSYIINIEEQGKKTMYIQAFNEYGLGEMTEVEIDTREIIQESLDTGVLEGVRFEIQFQGNGKYDIEILNSTNNKVYEIKNNLGKPGLNNIYWNGLDLESNPTEDGEYYIRVLGQDYFFSKEKKLSSAASYLNIHNGEIKSVDINLSTKNEGTLDLYIESKGNKKIVYRGISLSKNKNYNYNINILKYISVRDLKDAKILIEIE